MKYLRYNSPTVHNDAKRCTVDKAEPRGVNAACEKCVDENKQLEFYVGDTANNNEGTDTQNTCGDTYEDLAVLQHPANPPVYDVIMQTAVGHPLFVYEDTAKLLSTINKHGFVTTKGKCDKYGQLDTYNNVYGEVYDAVIQMYLANEDTIDTISNTVVDKYLSNADSVDFYIYSPPVTDGLRDGKRDAFRTMLTGTVYDAIYADAEQYVNIYLNAAQITLFQIPAAVIAEMTNNVPVTELAYRAAIKFIVQDAFYDITEAFVKDVLSEMAAGTEYETFLGQMYQLADSMGLTGSVSNPKRGTGFGGYPQTWGAAKATRAPDVRFFHFSAYGFTPTDSGNVAMMQAWVETAFNRVMVYHSMKYRWRV